MKIFNKLTLIGLVMLLGLAQGLYAQSSGPAYSTTAGTGSLYAPFYDGGGYEMYCENIYLPGSFGPTNPGNPVTPATTTGIGLIPANHAITTIYLRMTGTISGSAPWTGITLNVKMTQDPSFTSYGTTSPANTYPGAWTHTQTTTTFSITNTFANGNWIPIPLTTPFQYDPNKPLIVWIDKPYSGTNNYIYTYYQTTSGYNSSYYGYIYQSTSYYPGGSCSSNQCGQNTSGYRWDMGLDLIPFGGPPLPPIANFYQGQGDTTLAPADTVWLNSPQTLINTSSSQTRVYWDLPDETPLASGYFRQNVPFTQQQYIDTAKWKNNFSYIFTRRGWNQVRLLAVNFSKPDSLRDSIVKYIWVDTPSRVPKADFISFKRVLGFAEQSPFIDLSSYGPNMWEWTFDPPCNKCNNLPFAPNYFDPNQYAPNPKFTAFDPGIYTVCLRVWNARGMDSVCKQEYIKAVNGYNMCSGTGSYETTDEEGYIYGPSGPYFSYTRSQLNGCPGIWIHPCADSVTLYVERIKMLPSDSLEIFNGSAAVAANRIGAIGASTSGQLAVPANMKVIRGGRQIFVKFKTGSTGVPSGYDSASFSIRWAIKPASYTKPTAGFSIPDTFYTASPVYFVNQSVGILMKYNWDTDGNGTFDSDSASPTKIFTITIPAVKKVCLVSYNCVGSDTACKNVVFLPLNNPPVARFEANKTTGFNTDTFSLMDKSSYGPATWRWSFSPTTVQFMKGTTATSQNPFVRFTSAVAYTVKLVVTNALGADSVVRVGYISVTAYPTPSSNGDLPTIGDGSMGISRVRLNTIDSSFSNPFAPAYQFVAGNQATSLYRGVKYAASMWRPGTTSDMDRKMWIDFNMNASFEANELVMNEINAKTISRTDSFMIPNNQLIGSTRMRVAIDIGNSATLSPAYATLGMFKDFTIYFPRDTVRPTVALNGTATVSTEIHKPYVDLGITAFDNLEGNISHKYEIIGTVDTGVVGPNYIKYIVKDLYGNVSDTLYRTVLVELNRTGPSLTLTGASIINLEVNTTYVEPGYTALDNVGNNITSNVVITSNLNNTKIGNYTIGYTIMDAFGFLKTASRSILVRDNTAPVITAKFNNPYKHQVGNALDLSGIVKVTDNYDKNLQATYVGVVDVNNVGTYFIRYSATDSSGNKSADYLMEIQIGDIIPPVIQLQGSPNDQVEVYNNYIDPGVIVNDNYWPKNAISITTSGVVDVTKLGSYYITYYATDGSGNKDSVTRKVDVVKTSLPVIRLLGSNPVNLPRFCAYNDPGVSIDDAYYSDSVGSPLRLALIVDKTQLRNDIPGIYFITYSVTDPSGNKALQVQRSVNVLNTVCATGTEEAGFDAYFSLYPVPSNGKLYMDIKQQSEINSLRVYNNVGQLVKELDAKSFVQSRATIDLGTQPDGMYFVQVSTANGQFSKAVLLQR